MSQSLSGARPPDSVCLGMWHILIGLVLVLLTLSTVLGNVLVIMSILLYKRMRTFTNILLMSLASSDLLVGLFVMPLALVDLLHAHQWPFGRFICGVWATCDVLLCTASILNLCVISLDRYMAITSPLKYTRTRSRGLAGALLAAVWVLSLIVCSPPWFVPQWGLFEEHNRQLRELNSTDPRDYPAFSCAYSSSLPYRIYSAMGSFYIPLLVMLFVYSKIFRVANEREQLLSKNSTVRFSQKDMKAAGKAPPRNQSSPGLHTMATQSATRGTVVGGGARRYMARTNQLADISSGHKDSVDANEDEEEEIKQGIRNTAICRDFHSMIELDDDSMSISTDRQKFTRKLTTNDVPLLAQQAKDMFRKTEPTNLCSRASEYYAYSKPMRGSREKMVYMRERKALKTIGLVVSGFIVCWLPFFILYLVEVAVKLPEGISVVFDLFLWLGYSNSVLNPVIYTMYNSDFRRCFRDLIGCGCCRTHRRSMSVRRLQQSTMF